MEKAKSNKHIAPDSAKVSKVDFVDASSAPSKNTTLVKKKGAQAGDPAKQAKPSRKNVTSPDAGHAGARYGIRVKFQKQTAPEAGATQANGRLLPAAKPQAGNFKSGMAE
jgi:hypothetical protein